YIQQRRRLGERKEGSEHPRAALPGARADPMDQLLQWIRSTVGHEIAHVAFLHAPARVCPASLSAPLVGGGLAYPLPTWHRVGRWLGNVALQGRFLLVTHELPHCGGYAATVAYPFGGRRPRGGEQRSWEISELAYLLRHELAHNRLRKTRTSV